MDGQAESNIVVDAKQGAQSHDFSKMYKDLVNLQRHDHISRPEKFGEDIKTINADLHAAGVLHSCDIVGISDRDKIITRCGSHEIIQDASKFQDTNGGHHHHHHSGILGSIVNAVETANDAARAAVISTLEHPLDTVNKVAFMPLAIVDASAHTHTIKAVEEVEKGAANEVIHHPGKVLETFAIGAGVAALTVATGGGFAAGMAIGAAAIAIPELIKNRHNGIKGEWDGAVNDAKGLAAAFKEWGKDTVIVAGTGQHTQQQETEAKFGLQQAGVFAAETAAGFAGGIAGGVFAESLGLQSALPNAVKSPVDLGGPAPEAASVEVAANPLSANPTDLVPDFSKIPTDRVSKSSAPKSPATDTDEKAKNKHY